MGLTKQQLEALNQSSFPNNNAGAITPDILRQYNASVISNTVNQDTYSTDSASFSSSIASLNNFSSSLDATFATDAQLNASSSTLQANINRKLDTASFNSYTQSTNDFTASISTSVGLLQTFSGSEYKADSSSFDSRILAITASVPAGTVSSSAQIVAYNIFATTASVTASINTLSSSIYETDATQSNQISANSQSAATSFSASNASITSLSSSVSSISGAFATSFSASGANVVALSASIYTTDSNQQNQINSLINATSSYAISSSVKAVTDGLQNEINTLSTTASVNLLSASIFQTDATQSINIGNNSSSIGLLQTFSGSQYKNDSSSFDSRINSAGGNVSVQEEGTILGNATSFNFIGAGVTATVSSGTASVTIPGGGGTIATGSFATTGSNSFLGTQTLLETGSWGGVLLNVQSGSIKFNGQVADTGWEGTGSIFLTPVNLPHGSTKVVFQTEYQSGSTTPNGYDYILGIGRQGDTYSKTVDLGTDSTLDVSRANLVGFNFTTTASFNLFSGSQYKNDSASFDTRINSGTITGSSIVTASVSQSTITFTKGDNSTFNVTITGSTFDTGSLLVTASFDNGTRNLTFTKGDATTFNVNIPDVSGSNVDTSSLVTTASFNAYTQSTNTFTASQIVSNSYFATTGSNSFVGSQWFSDTNTNTYSALSEWSGSLILSAKGYTTSSFPQLTSSLANSAGVGFVNLLFKGDGVEANTILSGSNNILANPTAPTATFYRQVGNGNLALLGTLPQVSASMLFPITMNGNVINGTGNPITLRGPVSSSGWTINANNIQGTLNLGSSTALHAEKLVSAVSLTVNNIPGTLSIIANQSTITGSTTILGNTIAGGVTLNLSSSAIGMNNNIINDSSCTLTNAFYSSSLGFGTLSILRNNIGGQTNAIIVSGSQPAGTTNSPSFSDNFIGGGNNTIYGDTSNAAVVSTNAYHSALRNIVFGQQLIITGSSLSTAPSTVGSAFFGRYNDLSGNKDLTAQTIFAVGTGNSTTRKTGFLIDSGSNTFVEGTFNVSGSTAFTGSLTIQSGSGDLFVYGNKQFNVGAFYSTITQSGSAAVSQSMLFNNTTISQGVTLNGGTTQLTVTNSGTYNIQFSAQLLADTGADTIYIWLKKNGTNVDNTATKLVLANNEGNVAAWNFVENAIANDYFELCWQSTSGDAVLLAEAASGNVPAIPSVIVTVTQVR